MALDFPPFGGRRAGVVERFLLFVEQMDQAVRLLKSGRIARERMALVALDTLAEELLFHHVQAVFLASDEPTWVNHRTFTAKERWRARNRFSKKVELATEGHPDGWPMYPNPILDKRDAAIFRVAHHYRNSVQHEGRHNPALLYPLGHRYAVAVGRAFVASYPEGWAVSCSTETMRELTSLGWKPRDTAQFFNPREAATAIAPGICGSFQGDSANLGVDLGDDIAYRCDGIDAEIEQLRQDGLDGERLREYLEGAQEWAASRGDEALLRLKDEQMVLAENAKGKESLDSSVVEALRENQRQQWDLLFGSEREKRSLVDLASNSEFRDRGEKLRKSRGSECHLLEKYQQLDDELQVLEAAMDFVVGQWDRQQSLAEDVARGN